MTTTTLDKRRVIDTLKQCRTDMAGISDDLRYLYNAGRNSMVDYMLVQIMLGDLVYPWPADPEPCGYIALPHISLPEQHEHLALAFAEGLHAALVFGVLKRGLRWGDWPGVLSLQGYRFLSFTIEPVGCFF